MQNKNNAWLWIPTLYFASGLPYHAITSISDIMYKDMGIGNAQIAMYTSLLLIPWTIKPLWSPIVEMISTRRKWTLISQLLLAICFAVIALVIPSEYFLLLTLAAFFIGAFVSSTHDIALDGFYMLALPQEKQSFFSGIRNTFYRIATVFSSGVLVMIANRIAEKSGNGQTGWSATFAITGAIMLVLYLYHKKAVPSPASDTARTTSSIKDAFSNYGDIISSYFQKPGIWQALLFLLLFRFPEAQLAKMGKLFLMDSAAQGGLALDKGEIGLIYGVIGVIGLIIGGIVGGICISRKGLKYWLWPMVVAISLPDAVYIYMSSALPQDMTVISSCIFIEQLGYGFGFTAYTLYMIYFAQGKYPTAHFAISTAFMSLGMMLPGMFAGKLQESMGYENFFIWVTACTLITFIVSALVKIDPNFGKRQK
ncbi:MAG: MFS transporter [Bacteroidaceae bacterium]|nr:MFS transporter [Bacteroidaceae bacterium]